MTSADPDPDATDVPADQDLKLVAPTILCTLQFYTKTPHQVWKPLNCNLPTIPVIHLMTTIIIKLSINVCFSTFVGQFSVTSFIYFNISVNKWSEPALKQSECSVCPRCYCFIFAFSFSIYPCCYIFPFSLKY